MNRLMHKVKIGLIVMASAVFGVTAVAGDNGSTGAVVMEVIRGTLSFEVATNVPALRVHGKSSAIAGRARFRSGPEGVVLEQIEARVPVSSLGTGLGLRDEHMRKYIFTTGDGETPDVQFSGDRADCPTSGGRTTCTLDGVLAIRDIARRFTILLTVSEDNGRFRASGDGIVKLSAYGIDQPSQLGVRTTDEIKLKVDLTAGRPATEVSSVRAQR